jgi:hypothetical protein
MTFDIFIIGILTFFCPKPNGDGDLQEFMNFLKKEGYPRLTLYFVSCTMPAVAFYCFVFL